MAKQTQTHSKSGDEQIIQPGKIPPIMLERLLGLPRKTSEAVLVGPSLGEDAAVVRMPAGPVVITSDPITFKTARPGHYAVHINANDIAVMGAIPRYFTLTMILPPQTTFRESETIMGDAILAANDLDVVLIGGHSEVSESVSTPIVSVTMFGQLIGPRHYSTGDGRAGDAVIQVNPMAIEGTSILAHEHRERLGQEFGAEFVARAADFLYDPGLSVAPPARLAATRLTVHAMHDPTEGGLATGLKEIAEASRTGLLIREDRLLMADETRRICNALGYAPLGLISSGCLLFTVPAEGSDEAVRVMKEAGFTAADIGRLTAIPGDYRLETLDGGQVDLPVYDVDELAKA